MCLVIFACALSQTCTAAVTKETEELSAAVSATIKEEISEASAAADMPVEILAKSAVLIDVASGEILIDYNKDEKLFPASVTKIMTVLLAAEAIDSGKITLADKVTCSPNAASKGGSQIWLKEGEVMTVDELLRAAMIGSANDAATLLGEYVAGDEEAFVNLMNTRAAELGMKNTHFVNATGLDDNIDDHLTTAYDISIMARELMKHDFIRNYSTVWMDSLRGGATELVNTNKLVRFYKGTTGLKTGTTSKAGCCVAATAERDGLHLCAVVLGSANSTERFETAKKMLNWGFANYTTYTPEASGESFADIPVIGGENDFVTPAVPELEPMLVKKGSEEKIKIEVSLCEDLQAPVLENQTLGTLYIKLGDETVAEYTVKPAAPVEKLTFAGLMRRVACAMAEFAAVNT